MTADSRYYVYVHRDESGQIFYVGKGTGNRAWNRDRDIIWQRYVAQRSSGRYSVEIVRDGLSEARALQLEAELIEAFGPQLTNWINPGRAIDTQACHEYWRLRKESQRLTKEAKALATSDIEKSISLCREALELVHQYTSLTLETGLIAELQDKRTHGDAHVLYRLVQCLKSAKRYNEIIDEVDRYLSRYPGDAVHSQGVAALKARAFAEKKIQRDGRDARNGGASKVAKEMI